MTTSFDSTSCLAPEQERNDESETGCGSSDPSSGLADTKLGVPLGVGGEPIASQQLTDVERLRMLGYDATLGRPLGFWSSAAMNLCHMSFVYEFIALAGVLAYKGPLLFIIGYPCLAILNIVLLGPFAELASVFPISGAMATWAWRCARAGVRRERHWGYFTSGIVLAAHLGKTIAVLYHVATSMTQLYVVNAHVPSNSALQALEPRAWWNPTFHMFILVVVALVVLSRAGRSAPFWIGAGVYNIAIGIMFIGLIIAAGYKKHKNPVLGFPERGSWTHSFSYMIWMGLPLRPVSIDCSAHMAEETKDASVSVPRAMYAATITHYVFTYLLMMLYICYITPKAGALSTMARSRHYIGPVIAMTKHTAGLAIDPHDFATATGRANAIQSYMKEEMGMGLGIGHSLSPLQMLSRSRFWNRSNSSKSKSTTPTSTQMPSMRSPRSTIHRGKNTQLPSPSRRSMSAVPESTAFPMSFLRSSRGEDMEQALAESQALPETVMWQTQTSNSYRRSSGGNTSANASNAINRISDVTATDSGRNSKASPFKRGQSRASDHTSRVRYGAAQAESAIEPEEDDDEPALLESQLDPTRMRNLGSWGRNGPQQTVSTGAVGVSTGTLRQSHPHPLAYGQENFGQSEDSIERFAPVSLPVPPKRR